MRRAEGKNSRVNRTIIAYCVITGPSECPMLNESDGADKRRVERSVAKKNSITRTKDHSSNRKSHPLYPFFTVAATSPLSNRIAMRRPSFRLGEP